MFYIITWILVLLALAAWTLLAWGFDALVSWSAANGAAWAAGSAPTEALHLPAWLADWVPPDVAAALTSALAALGPLVETAMSHAPSLAGGLSWLVWIAWGLGAFVLLLAGALLSGVIKVFRRRSAGPSAAAT
jgi:hypothetical protein